MSQYVRLRTEGSEQETVIQWARLSSGKYPELMLLHHIPNGGSRNKKEAVKLKRMGVLAGVADLHLPVAHAGYSSLYIEMKYDDGRLLKSQKTFLRLAAAFGNYCAVCYSAADAIKVMQAYLNDKTDYDNLPVIKEGEQIGRV